MSGMHLSREFFELLKAIGESKSKQEEDRIIKREIQTLKKKLEGNGGSGGGGGVGGVLGGKKKGGPNHIPGVGHHPSSHHSGGTNSTFSNKKKAKEFLLRLLYVEMMGHDASFGYIKAVEMCASSSIVLKKTGYTLCGACLPPTHEFRFMLVNQMQRDLSSSHVLECCTALVAVTNIITSDMVPAISNEVIKLIEHKNEQVRKKAILALHRFHQISPDTVDKTTMIEKLRRALCDRDPSVMGSCLNAMDAMSHADPTPFRDLVPSLISILKQIMEHRLPSDFDYHRVPAPWMQMKIVRILGTLCKNDASSSEHTYEMLSECMKRADVGINAGYAVVYECVRTITSLYPNPTLLDAAAESISRFLDSRSHNLKYLGVTGLASIVESHPQYAEKHQLAVIECLEDTDETLQRRTLDLLYKMTNSQNVQFITDKLLSFLRERTTDAFLKKDLTQKVCHLAERYAPSNLWYMETMTELFELSGDLVSHDVSQNLMTLIAEGNTEEEEEEESDMLLRQHAVELYVDVLDRPNARFPKLLTETAAWVLGEYAYLSAEHDLEQILTKLCFLVRKGTTLAVSSRKIVVTAIMKLVAQAGTCPPSAAKVIDDFTKSKDYDLQQRCLEFQTLLTTAPHLLGEVLPVDASCEDLQVDPHLSFLNSYVQQCVHTGSKPYSKPEDDDSDDEDDSDDYYRGKKSGKKTQSSFNLTPYEKPSAPAAGSFGNMRGVGSSTANPNHNPHHMNNAMATSLPPGVASNAATTSTTLSSPTSQSNTHNNEPQLVLRNVANVWGKGGINASNPAAAAPAVNSSSNSSSNAWANSYTSTSQPTTTSSSTTSYAPSSSQHTPQEPVKTEEQKRKESMAAALFGGGGGADTKPTSVVARRRAARQAAKANANATTTTTPVFPNTPTATSIPPTPAPTPAAAPPPPSHAAPAPDPEIDLLDFMSGSDPTPPAPPVAATNDIFASTPSPMPTTPVAPPVGAPAAPVPEPVPAPAPASDPFADSGLLDGFHDAPLPSTTITQAQPHRAHFSHNGLALSPLPINTQQFGQSWGTLPFTHNVQETNTAHTLASMVDTCRKAGCAEIESIAATNEGICGGTLNNNNNNQNSNPNQNPNPPVCVLVHGKVIPTGSGHSNVQMTIKSTDGTVGGAFAVYLQNMLR